MDRKTPNICTESVDGAYCWRHYRIISHTPRHQRRGELKRTCWICIPVPCRNTGIWIPKAWPTPLRLLLMFLLVIYSLKRNANIYLNFPRFFFIVFTLLRVFTSWIHINDFLKVLVHSNHGVFLINFFLMKYIIKRWRVLDAVQLWWSSRRTQMRLRSWDQ